MLGFHSHSLVLSLGRASASGPISEVLYIRTEWPRSIYQYSNMALRLSGQTSIFGVVLYSSLLGIQQPRSQGPVLPPAGASEESGR